MSYDNDDFDADQYALDTGTDADYFEEEEEVLPAATQKRSAEDMAPPPPSQPAKRGRGAARGPRAKKPQDAVSRLDADSMRNASRLLQITRDSNVGVGVDDARNEALVGQATCKALLEKIVDLSVADTNAAISELRNVADRLIECFAANVAKCDAVARIATDVSTAMPTASRQVQLFSGGALQNLRVSTRHGPNHIQGDVGTHYIATSLARATGGTQTLAGDEARRQIEAQRRFTERKAQEKLAAQFGSAVKEVRPSLPPPPTATLALAAAPPPPPATPPRINEL